MRRYGAYEPRHETNGCLHICETKTQISFAVTVKLISAYVFAIPRVQSLYFLNLKFQATSKRILLQKKNQNVQIVILMQNA